MQNWLGEKMEPKISINNYINVSQRAEQFGSNEPIMVALLPENFDIADSISTMYLGREASTVRILFRRAGIIETPIEPPDKKLPEQAHNEFSDWIGPIIFFSSTILSQNPQLISIFIGVLSNYLYDLFKGLSFSRNASLSIVVERKDGTCKKLSYNGPVSGLKIFENSIVEIMQ
jgi:hypothetical protein